MSELTCPFCGEHDFDAVGLKSHLLHGDCEKFNETELPALPRLFAYEKEEKEVISENV